MAQLAGYTLHYEGKNRYAITPDGNRISYSAYRNIVAQSEGFESRYAVTKANKPITHTTKTGFTSIVHEIGKPRDLPRVIEDIRTDYNDKHGIALGIKYLHIDEMGHHTIRYGQTGIYRNKSSSIDKMLDDIGELAEKYELARVLSYYVIMYPVRERK